MKNTWKSKVLAIALSVATAASTITPVGVFAEGPAAGDMTVEAETPAVHPDESSKKSEETAAEEKEDAKPDASSDESEETDASSKKEKAPEEEANEQDAAEDEDTSETSNEKDAESKRAEQPDAESENDKNEEPDDPEPGAAVEETANGTVIFKIRTAGGSVSVITGKDTSSKKILRVEDDGTRTVNGEAVKAENDELLRLETEEGTSVYTEILADEGYQVAFYAVSTDAGTDKDVVGDGVSSYNKDISVNGTKIVEIGFEKAEEVPAGMKAVEDMTDEEVITEWEALEKELLAESRSSHTNGIILEGRALELCQRYDAIKGNGGRRRMLLRAASITSVTGKYWNKNGEYYDCIKAPEWYHISSWNRYDDNTKRSLYCVDLDLSFMTPRVYSKTSYSLSDSERAELGYVIQNGVQKVYEKAANSKYSVGDAYFDYYVTQIAVWGIVRDYGHTDKNGNSSGAKMSTLVANTSRNSNASNILAKAKLLYNDAKAYRQAGKTVKITAPSDTAMRLNEDKSAYVSGTYKVAAANAKSVSVSLTGAPEGTEIVYASGKDATKGFTLRIPADKVDEDASFKIKASATFSDLPLLYFARDGYQRVVMGGTPVDVNDTDEAPASLTVEKKTPRGDFTFVKEGSNKRKLAGVPFTITSNDTGETQKVVSDRNGVVDTSKQDIWFGSESERAEGAGKLPLGTYTVHEERTRANYGFGLVPDFTVDVVEENTMTMVGTVIDGELSIVKTTATDKASGTKTVPASKDAVIVDHVEYSGLTPGKTYTLRGVLMDKAANAPFLTGSEEVRAEKEFIPDSADGTVDVEFAFDASNVSANTKLVVFEYLDEHYGDGAIEVAKHEDINDEGQTVTVPSGRTTAKDAKTNSKVGAAVKEAKVTDRFTYTGLDPDITYELSGSLRFKDTGSIVKDASGKEVTAVKTLKAGEHGADGYVDMEFTFDASLLQGKTVVAFERLTENGRDVVVHEDLTDEPQTVYYPDVKTSAKDEVTNASTGVAGSKTTIVDTVAYSNLVPGKEYTVSGTLYNAATGEAVLSGGKAVTASTTFTAESKNGTVEMTFTFDASAMKGKSAVVFEDLFCGDVKVATHSDLKDKAQTVSYPLIGTTAKDAASGTKQVASSKDAKIIDTVAYKGLVVGETYTLKGNLVSRKSGNEIPLKNDASVTFKAEKADGTIDVELVFDSSAVKEDAVVVFEKLFLGEQEIAVHEDLTDEDQTIYLPGLKTNATDGQTKTHVGTVGSKETIVDRVTYSGLVTGKEYTVSGTLHNKETGEAIKGSDGRDITASVTFTATKANGSVDLIYELDSTLLAGKSVVVFEDLENDGLKVASHANLNDKAQTISYPDVKTSAKDNATGTHTGTAGKTTTIIDTVTYTNLVVGEEYVLEGILKDAASGEDLMVGGKPVTASKTFTPDNANGTIEMTFTFDGSALRGKDTVVFEDLYHNEMKVASHADLNDKDQTVSYPSIKTSAKDAATQTKQLTVSEKAEIIDTVTYQNLVVGETYTVKGRLMNKADGSEIPLLKNAEVTFTAEKENGTINMKLVFDASVLKSGSTVVFEKLMSGDIEVAAHEDINDAAQTVEIPKIRTNAADGKTKDHTGTVGKTETIIDTVTYEGLIPGKEYTVEGVLMNKDDEKPVIGADGEEIKASVTFTAKKANGSVDLVYEVDSTLLAGKTVVVFEDLLFEGVKVASHADINDEDQSVHYPSVATTAIDGQTKDGVGTVAKAQTIVDTVAYTNLVAGQEYILRGSLVYAENGKPVTKNGKAVTAEMKFQPEKANGSVEMTFEVDASVLAGKKTVVFEDLYHADVKVASHADINDEGQTVSYPEIRTMAKDKTTKSHQAVSKERAVIVDTVSYKDLVVGKAYTIKGRLMNKADGTEVPLLEKAEITFTAEKSNGTINMELVYDSSKLEGSTVVVFEKLYHNDIEVHAHEDLEDEDQSVEIPKIRTNAADGKTKDHTGTVGKTETIIDTVTYEGLIPGKEYTVEGVLMNKDDEKPVIGADGEEIKASVTFTAKKANGSVDLVYEVDSTLLAGKTVVVFEDLLFEGVKVASHADINDEDQSVHYPSVATTAIDGQTKDGVGTVAKAQTIVDTVAYTNLVAGQEYILRGSLVYAENGKPVTKNGKAVTAEMKFQPEKANGSVEMTFEVDASVLAGKKTVVFEDLYHADVKVASHADINDEGQTVSYPEIRTMAKDKTTKSHQAVSKERAVIVDTVSYKDLVVGKAYTIKGRLMNKADGTEVPLLENAEITFTAEQADGAIDMELVYDSSKLEGTTVVVFERLYHNDVEVYAHEDLEDEDQSVEIPKIRTNAADGKTKSHVGTVGTTETVVDVVTYEHLIPGTEYTVEGLLMYKDSAEPVIDADGEPITASTTFKPESANGTVELIYEVDSTLLAGKTVVVFEDLLLEGVKITSHADITDEDQTVYYPDIRTEAKDKATQMKQVAVSEEATVVDTVSYHNLKVGETYTVTGRLMNKADGSEIPLKNKAEITFVAEEADGTVEMELVFDAKVLEGQTTVVFEKLFHNGIEVTAHEDIEDEAQTVEIPKIRTNASDGQTKSHTGTVGTTETIVDVVTYENLIVGQDYVVEGTLVNKETGDPILMNGEKVVAKTEFKAEEKSGSVELTYTIDSTVLQGATVVVFEDLLIGEIKVASHADINDEEQSVHYPKLKTQANVGGKQQITAGGTVKLIDTVTYTNLIPGKEYIVKGVLMDKATGKALLVGGKEVTAQKKFTAEQADGTVEMVFTLASGSLGGKTVVVFEDLYEGEIKVASHADINDKDQSIVVNYPPTPPKKTPQTGDTTNVILWAGLAAAAVVLLLFLFLKKRKKNR